ncbi:hypothetical protein [Saccharospirillum alexandrii]|uniref:hypothetical protein n=1 Tax=Saccharospirillum alexandrii TaxID=2448477 RepID=UPI000FDAC7EB|nr:hypothetical protein [Saccharospirillum alexandrii]
MNRKAVRYTFCFLTFSLLGGCASFFTTHFDTTRLSNLTTLKAMHIIFLDNWTVGSGNAWDESKVSEACESGGTRFREAHEYAKSTDLEDGTAEKAVSLVWRQFEGDCDALLEDEELFSSEFSSNLKLIVEGNYNKAIEGEKSRIGYD